MIAEIIHIPTMEIKHNGEHKKKTPISSMEYNKKDNLKDVIEHNAHQLFPIAARLLDNQHDAEEIIQEAFLKLWEKPPNLKNQNAITPWLKKVVVNLAIDRIRKKQRNRKYNLQNQNPYVDVDPEPNPEQHILEQQQKNYVRSILNTIPKRQKIAITLIYYENMSNREAAHIMNLSVEALESLLARGRKNILKNHAKIK